MKVQYEQIKRIYEMIGLLVLCFSLQPPQIDDSIMVIVRDKAAIDFPASVSCRTRLSRIIELRQS